MKHEITQRPTTGAKHRKTKWHHTAISLAALLVFGLVFVLVGFFSDTPYAMTGGFLQRNRLLLFVSVPLAVAVAFFAARRGAGAGPGETRGSCAPLVRASLVLLAVQLFVSYHAFFLALWDVGRVRNAALEISRLGSIQNAGIIAYFQNYPNNKLLTLLCSLILRLEDSLGILPPDYETFSLVVVNCLILNFASLLTGLILRKLLRPSFAAAGYIASVLLFGLSPWMIVPYSDTFGVLIPILSLYILLLRPKSLPGRAAKWVAVFLLATAGYHIKPQCLIVFIAALCVYFFDHLSPKGLLRTACLALSFALVFSAGSMGIDRWAAEKGFSDNDEAVFGWQHFLMMGLSRELSGVYTVGDVEYSRSFAAADERNAANLAEAARRVREFGPAGLAEHLAKKILTVFNDGTLSWGREGGFYWKMPEVAEDSLAARLRSVLYLNETYYRCYAYSAQALWIGVLFLCLFGVLPARRRNSGLYSVLLLSLLGLFLFEMLFEARARYLFAYAPFFVILAMTGAQNMGGLLVRRRA